jgi:hypothetical protein
MASNLLIGVSGWGGGRQTTRLAHLYLQKSILKKTNTPNIRNKIKNTLKVTKIRGKIMT